MVSGDAKDAVEWLIIITVILVNLLVFRNGPLQGLAFFFFLSIPIVFIVIIVSQKRTREAQANPSTQNRTIPSNVKQYVWRRDGGRCVECGSREKLEYDHIIQVSKGGSNTERNVQLLCEHCNRIKHAKIM